MQESPPAGWYPDPQGQGEFRWWDGAQWHATAPQGTRPDTGPGSVEHWLLPVGRSWQSIVAGYLGLLSLVIIFLGPLALAFGLWGLRRAADGGHGRGRCILGIVGGLWGTVVLVYLLSVDVL